FVAQTAAIFSSAQTEMFSQSNFRGNICHVLPAHQLGPNTRQFPFVPFWMKQKQRFADHQAEDCISKKFKPFVVAGCCKCIRTAFLILLVGEGAMSQCADQQLWVSKAMSQCNFQFGQNCFHILLLRCRLEEAMPPKARSPDGM